MYCTFYRPATINTTEYENIIGKLRYDLHLLENEGADEWSVYAYFYALGNHVRPSNRSPEMLFLDLADPTSMPSDSRVYYVYRPTYIATAFMIKAVLLYPSLMNDETFMDSELDLTADSVKRTLAACMLACTGRGFDGAGVLRLKDCIKMFCDAGTDKFLEKYPDLCPAFTEMYHERKAFVSSGKTDPREAWFKHNH